jgi:hypothetical protein
MAYKFTFADGSSTVNLVPETATKAIWYLKEALKSAGWVVKHTFKAASQTLESPDSTGTTSDISPDSDGLASNGSWFVIQQPSANADSSPVQAPFGGTRQYIFVRGNDDKQWYIGYSYTGTFGNATVTDIAYAPDEKPVIGSVPFVSRNTSNHEISGITFTYNMFPDVVSTGGSVLQLGVSDKAPFTFYFVNYISGTNQNADTGATTGFMTEAMAPGTFTFDSDNPYNPAFTDIDPIVHYIHPYIGYYSYYGMVQPTAAFSVGMLSQSATNGKMWFKPTSGNAQWGNVSAGLTSFTSGSVPNGMGNDHITNKVILVPIQWGSGSLGLRGIGSTFRWPSSNLLHGQLVSGATDKVCFDDLVFPWPSDEIIPFR